MSYIELINSRASKTSLKEHLSGDEQAATTIGMLINFSFAKIVEGSAVDLSDLLPL